MEEHGAEEFFEDVVEKSANDSIQEEGGNTGGSRSSNASEAPPQESQVAQGEEEDEECQEGSNGPKQVYKKPARKSAKNQKKMSITEVQKGMDANSSKLAEDINNLKKTQGGAKARTPGRIEEA